MKLVDIKGYTHSNSATRESKLMEMLEFLAWTNRSIAFPDLFIALRTLMTFSVSVASVNYFFKNETNQHLTVTETRNFATMQALKMIDAFLF